MLLISTVRKLALLATISRIVPQRCARGCRVGGICAASVSAPFRAKVAKASRASRRAKISPMTASPILEMRSFVSGRIYKFVCIRS